MLPRLQQAHHHPPEGSPFEHHDSTSGPTSDYDDNEIEEFYDQLQNAIDQTPKKDILVVQGNWNAKVRKDACKIRIREDSDFWSLPPLTILCRRTLLVITKHPEDGPGIAQMDNTTARFIIFS